ncbi:DUF397 domain-containing protein [Streptomyces sporangiiformans]|uniref:DUF397 domain-containing protein n=1 Tax=Streptomyces sporangiiformans TaxID=2315329 RepID=A0A505DRE3_9ACTN|nr:DUF397 domain-containing protein [Streptomyces sporangiiformans]TPQ23682.1 DUF397 domain-containing protein [Streptomyces sporangiiformans]
MSTTELTWFKSSHSSSGSGDCVEVALSWPSEGAHCVDVTPRPDTIQVRDSKVKQGSQLALAPATWTAFLTYATRS